MRNKAAALFVRCSEEDAERIRKAATAERRTVSGYILNAVFNRMDMRERLAATGGQGGKPAVPQALKIVD